MKSYTDVSQSKKLTKILPLESADMKILPFTEREYRIVPINDIAVCGREDEIYAWSLSALLGVLPNNENISTNLSKGGYKISTLEYTNSWFVDYEDEINGLNNCVTSADNPVDACVAMIEKLNELNLLKL